MSLIIQGFSAKYCQNCSEYSSYTIRTILVDLLDDLPEGGGLDLHPHHGEDAAHVIGGDCAVLVSEAVKAPLEHLDLVGLEADVSHLLLGEVLLYVRHAAPVFPLAPGQISWPSG